MQVFLGGHMDTVFGEKHPFQKTVQKEHILNGPGVADLKGGLVVMLHALLTLEKSDAAKNIGWEVLINPDEEIGSLGSGPLFKEAAARNLLGMVYEPALDNGGFAGERKGSGNFTVVMQGRAAHAGRDFAKGRNAIVALSEYVTRVNALNGTREGVTINPGVIRGGAATNIVPYMAVMRFNVRTSVMDDQVWMEAQLDEIAKNFAGREGFSHRIYGGFTRAPKKLDAKHLALYEAMKSTGETLGLKLGWQPTGGACDGNNLSAAGLPNIDTLGVRGGALHSDSEWMDTGSLVERARLSAAFLQRLAVGDVKL